MSANLDFKNIPEQLSDEDARAYLDAAAPRSRQVNDAIVRINDRAEQARQRLAQLQQQAREVFKTDDPEELQKILEQRRLANGQNVRRWISSLEEREAQIAAVNQAVAPAGKAAPR